MCTDETFVINTATSHKKTRFVNLDLETGFTFILCEKPGASDIPAKLV